ncbi:MAG TPA: hypothetical protein VGH19_06680 [Verrucomicrobiae bacterium]
MDAFKNFAWGEVASSYGASDTSIDLVPGWDLPAVPFNAVWYNRTDFPGVRTDPYKEIVRVTAIVGNTLTITRAQEGTLASAKNLSGKTYELIAPLTAKSLNEDIKVVQTVDGSTTSSFSIAGSTTANRIVTDGSQPQSNEGVQIAATPSFQPKSLSNFLEFTVNGNCSMTTIGTPSFSLFKDSDAGASDARSLNSNPSANYISLISIFWRVPVTSLSAQVWKLRAGPDNSGTLNINPGLWGSNKLQFIVREVLP